MPAIKSTLVLVQDSDFQRRTKIGQVLKLNGCDVLEAVNPQHAELICRQKGDDVDVVVADTESLLSSEWKRLCPRAQLLSFPLALGSAEKLSAQILHLLGR